MNLAVATVGDNCIDRYLPPIARSMVGGNAVNVAVRLRQLGLDSAYYGAVGDDADGRRTIDCLRGIGVRGDGIRIIAGGRTAYTLVARDASGDRHFLAEDFGACRGYRPTALEVDRLLQMRHVHIGWFDDAGELKRRLAAAGVSVSQDLSVNAEPRNLDPQGLTVGFASATPDEAEARLERLMQDAVHIGVVMCGEQGAMASDGTKIESVEIKPVSVVDTTGAGDSFIAGFIAAWVREMDLAACLASGRDAAAETCRHLGGFRQEPLPYSG